MILSGYCDLLQFHGKLSRLSEIASTVTKAYKSVEIEYLLHAGL